MINSKSTKRGGRKGDGDATDMDGSKGQLEKFQQEMEDALLEDIQSNKNKKMAIKRLVMLNKIDSFLRKQNLHEDFLDKDGCQRLSDWLKPLPDKTYPNQKIVECILRSIDRLPITDDLLKVSDLENSLSIYKRGIAGPGYSES